VTTPIEKVVDGLQFTEGPVWSPAQQCLFFTDIPGNRIYQWSAARGLNVFREPSQMANGLARDAAGRLIACEHATSRVTRTEVDGAITVLASHYGGKELNSPNDVVVASNGAIYFTDPVYGRSEYYGVPRPPQLDFRGLYRIAPDGGPPVLLANDFGQPNGLCFSTDEKCLFVNDTERGHIRAFDVAPDGLLSGGQVWAKVRGEGAGAADGMKIDSQGRLHCTGPGGIHVFDSEARLTGVIPVPESAANFTWGDADLRSLYITATHSLYRVRVEVPGRPAPR
jgi:gluconolactonase